MRKYDNLVGQKFGRLTVQSFFGIAKNGHSTWLCVCECGNKKTVQGSELKRGNVLSCGCWRRESHITHGDSVGSRRLLYKCWKRIKSRCVNKNDKNYLEYGARGISMCLDWRDSYENFRDWALSAGWRQGLTIERIDVNGNYMPENCRWATRAEQSRNKRNNVYVEMNGEKVVLSEAARRIGITPSTLSWRIRKFGIEKALSMPVDKGRQRQRLLCA